MHDLIAYLWIVASHWIAVITGIAALITGAVDYLIGRPILSRRWMLIGTAALLLASLMTGFELFEALNHWQEQSAEEQQAIDANHVDTQKMSLQVEGLNVETEEVKLTNQQLRAKMDALDKQMRQTEAYWRRCQSSLATRSQLLSASL